MVPAIDVEAANGDVQRQEEVSSLHHVAQPSDADRGIDLEPAQKVQCT